MHHLVLQVIKIKIQFYPNHLALLIIKLLLKCIYSIFKQNMSEFNEKLQYKVTTNLMNFNPRCRINDNRTDKY